MLKNNWSKKNQLDETSKILPLIEYIPKEKEILLIKAFKDNKLVGFIYGYEFQTERYPLLKTTNICSYLDSIEINPKISNINYQKITYKLLNKYILICKNDGIEEIISEIDKIDTNSLLYTINFKAIASTNNICNSNYLTKIYLSLKI
jgi:hypothetical protein